jgi:phosphonate transport system substrate-binding protein
MGEWAGPLRFGISRLHGGLRLEASSQAFAALLGQSLAVPASVTVTEDYPRLLDALLDGQVELAWLSPFSLARALQRGADLAVLCERRGRLLYRSGLVVHVDSPIKRVDELRGARAAWTNASSAAGYFVPREHLRQHGIDPDDLAMEMFYGSTSASCGAVYAGDADLATCYLTDQAASDPELARKELEHALGPVMGPRLRLLDVTAPIPPDGLAFSPKLPQPARARMRTALLGLDARPGGPHALSELLDAERLDSPTDQAMRMLAELATLVSGRNDDVTVA